MKKVGGMMYAKVKRGQKGQVKCHRCGKELTPATAFYYVDGNNYAISQNAPPYCYECYRAVYKR